MERRLRNSKINNLSDILQQEWQSCLVYLGRHVLLLLDRSELREKGEKVGLIAGLRDLSVAQPIEADSANLYLFLCR